MKWVAARVVIVASLVTVAPIASDRAPQSARDRAGQPVPARASQIPPGQAPRPDPAVAEASLQAAYRDLSDVQGRASGLKDQLEPYREWNAAEDAVWKATYQEEQARRDARDAKRQLDNFDPSRYGIAKSAASSEEIRLRRQLEQREKEVQEASRAREEAMRRRVDLEQERFSDGSGRRRPREEIEKTFNELNDRLSKLEEEEQEAKRRIEEATSRTRQTPQPPVSQGDGASIVDLERHKATLERAGSQGVASLADIAEAIRTGDCRIERFARARDLVHQAITQLLEVARASWQDAATGQPNAILQGFGVQALADLNAMAAALKALETAWSERCGQPAGCVDPHGGVIAPAPPSPGASAPAGPDPGGRPPFPSPNQGGPLPPVNNPPGGGAATPNPAPVPGLPARFLNGLPLPSDLRAALEQATSPADVARLLDDRVTKRLAGAPDLAGKTPEEIRAALQARGSGQSHHLWWAGAYRQGRVLLDLLQRGRLADLAVRIAVMNLLLPETGDPRPPDGLAIDAVQDGTIGEFIDRDLAGQRTPGSLFAYGQPDTPEFRATRDTVDAALANQAKDYAAKRDAAEKASRAADQAIGRHNQAAARVTVGPPPGSTLADVAALRKEEQEALAARDQAVARRDDANEALRQARLNLGLLGRLVGERPLYEILSDPNLTVEARRKAVDDAIAGDVADSRAEYIRIRDLETFEAVNREMMHPALAPLHRIIVQWLQRIGFSAEDSTGALSLLQEIYELDDMKVRLDQQVTDGRFLNASAFLAGVTLVGIAIAPQFTIPILAITGVLDAAVAAAEVPEHLARVQTAQQELERVKQIAGIGQADAGAVEAAEGKLADAQTGLRWAEGAAVLSAAGAVADAAVGGVKLAKALGGVDEAGDALVDATVSAGRGAGQSGAAPQATGAVAAAPDLPGVPGRGPPQAPRTPTQSVSAPQAPFPYQPTDPASPLPPRFGDLPTERAGVPAAPTIPEAPRPASPVAGAPAPAPPAPAPAAAAASSGAFDPTGTLGDIRPPGVAHGWDTAHAATLDRAMGLRGDDAASAATGLQGAQVRVETPGGGAAIEVDGYLGKGGNGMAMSAGVVPPARAASALPPVSPLRLDPTDLRPPLYPLPPDGRVAVKFYDVDGMPALKNELEGAHYREAAGLDYAHYFAWGTLPDGTPYVVKELVDGPQLMIDGVLTIGEQRVIVEGLADNARKGIVELDGRPDNWFIREVVLPDGTRGERLATLDTGYISPVARPSPAVAYDWFQWGDEFADGGAFFNRWLHPDVPVLGGGALPIQSLMGLDRGVIAQMQKHPLVSWFNNLMEMERRGLIQFDTVTRTFKDGQIPISMLRDHPEWKGVVAEVERIVQGGAPLVGTAVTEIGAIRRTFDGTIGGVSRAVNEILGGLGQANDAFKAARAAGNLAPPVTGTLSHLASVVIHLPGGGNVDPFAFMANDVPRCWSSFEQVTEVPPGAGGGFFVRITTRVADEIARVLKTNPQVRAVEVDKVEKAQIDPPNDPFYSSRGSWMQAYDDQWGLKRIGLAQNSPLWDVAAGAGRQVIVAVIDSGLDYRHPDLGDATLWRNPMEAPNGRDDDGNGYVDDLIGWDFVNGTNDPSDDLGHGTHVAGIIAARTGNKTGIAGINPRARIMPLKVLDGSGQGLASHVAAAVFYAVRHGAHVINLSLGERGISETERMAVRYARDRGVVVVVAGGNAASNTNEYGPAGLPGVIAVAALGPDDKRQGFSNWGSGVSLAAPGVEILSLRAGQTDLNLSMGVDSYKAGAAVVGSDGRYYRATGTSFAAPFVTGVASLLLTRTPTLTPDDIERMLVMSADDVEVTGWDQYTGAGRLNADAALKADPKWQLTVRVTTVQPAQQAGRTVIEVRGTVTGSSLSSYSIQVGQGATPGSWQSVGQAARTPVDNGLLGSIPATAITSAGQWTIRVVARDATGAEREARGTLTVR